MNVFLQGLTHVQVGLTVGGLFLVTKESALTVRRVDIIKEMFL